MAMEEVKTETTMNWSRELTWSKVKTATKIRKNEQ